MSIRVSFDKAYKSLKDLGIDTVMEWQKYPYGYYVNFFCDGKQVGKSIRTTRLSEITDEMRRLRDVTLFNLDYAICKLDEVLKDTEIQFEVVDKTLIFNGVVLKYSTVPALTEALFHLLKQYKKEQE